MATCSTSTLADAASGFSAVPAGMVFPVKLALLVQILQARNPGFTLNIQQLVTDAACFECIPPGLRTIVKLALLCNIVGGIAAVDPCDLISPSNLVLESKLGTTAHLTWTDAPNATSIRIYIRGSPGVTPQNATSSQGPVAPGVQEITLQFLFAGPHYFVAADTSDLSCYSNEVGAIFP